MSTVSRKIGVSALLAGVCVLTILSGAKAADMPMPPPPSADNQMMEYGTGWYLRGDVGMTEEYRVNTRGTMKSVSGSFPNSWSIGGGFGYKYNDWIRTDVTGDYRGVKTTEGVPDMGVQCQTGAYAQHAGDTANGTPLFRYVPVYDASGCYSRYKSRSTNVTVLFNVYADLGTYYGFTPYIGGGVGFNINYEKARKTWYQGSYGVAYNPSWNDPISGLPESRNWDSAYTRSNWNFAWALMGGVSYALTSNTTVDIGYRYTGLGKNNANVEMRSHDVRLGLRYMPDF